VRRFHLIALLVVALVGAAAALAVTRSPVLGLDLQGGLEIVLQAEAPPGQQITQDALDRSVSIIRNRIDKLGVAEPEIRTQGGNQIVIELAGLHDPEKAAALIGKTAELQFYDLEGDAVPPSIDVNRLNVIPSPTLYPLLKRLQPQVDKAGTPTAWYLYSKQKKLLAGPSGSKEDLLRQVPGGKAPAGSEILAVPGNRIVLTCQAPDSIFCPGLGSPPSRPVYYLFKYQPTAATPIPELTGRDLQLRGTRQDFDQQNQPIVTLQFTGSGEDKFHAITKELAQRGVLKTQQFGSADNPLYQHFAIVLDNTIVTAPFINFEENPDGIAGNAQISGLDSVQQAKDLALVLQTGALPLKFEQQSRTDISATLGKDSLHQALVAGIGGIVAVAVFLLLVYRFLGLVAIVGLAIYGALLYAALLLFNVTLTLPGFAGLILTIGVAADANVVIFERIKEEVRAGKSVRAGITAGYRKGFHTIVDANVVTMITAFILFAVATAGVKGFALMLLIGTLLSMFTAVAATRAMLGLLSNFRWFDNPSFMGATAKPIPAWQRFDFMGKRKVWYALSATVLAIGIVSLGVQGLNLGIDFKGGSQISFKTPKPLTVDQVRTTAGTVIPQDAVIQGRGPTTNGRFGEFQIRTKSLTTPQQNALSQTLENDLDASSLGVTNVSSSFSGQILRNAILAVCVSLLLIFLYVWLRFGWKFGVPVMVALVHDVFITLGIYSLVQREVSAPTVAAVLTILGYSIYDTIIIFDRVRENVPLMRSSSFAAIANTSIWETIRRSLATTFITLLPVTSLLLFGGDTLKDFAFALLVGIVSGAYSTIFIATPMLVILKEREPEYAARKELGAQEAKIEGPAAEPSRLAWRAAGVLAGARSGGRGEAPAEPFAEALDAAEPEPAGDGVPEEAAPPAPPASAPAPAGDAAARREARRQRRRARPHGRAR
jgi:SecD/SecF fusion protein